MQESATPASAHIEIGQPRLFKLGTVLIVSAFGILLALPFLAALLLVSVLQLGIWTILIPLLAVASATVFLPVGLGNPYVSRLVRAMNPVAGESNGGFVVQLTVSPRIRSGLTAVLEDADDIGYLSFDSAGFRFQGDSVKLVVPFSSVREVRPQNIGMRGLFVYGRRIGVALKDVASVNRIEFAERSSWLLPTSRRITRQLQRNLSQQ
jgi:hypothetical protein